MTGHAPSTSSSTTWEGAEPRDLRGSFQPHVPYDWWGMLDPVRQWAKRTDGLAWLFSRNLHFNRCDAFRKGKKLWHFGVGVWASWCPMGGHLLMAKGQACFVEIILLPNAFPLPPHATLRDPQGTKKIETHLNSFPLLSSCIQMTNSCRPHLPRL